MGFQALQSRTLLLSCSSANHYTTVLHLFLHLCFIYGLLNSDADTEWSQRPDSLQLGTGHLAADESQKHFYCLMRGLKHLLLDKLVQCFCLNALDVFWWWLGPACMCVDSTHNPSSLWGLFWRADDMKKVIWTWLWHCSSAVGGSFYCSWQCISINTISLWFSKLGLAAKCLLHDLYICTDELAEKLFRWARRAPIDV